MSGHLTLAPPQSSNETTFACTKCGRCCEDHNLPLTWDEAVSWLEEDGKVDVYCEADVWHDPVDHLRAAHRRRRPFPALCGNIEIQVTVIFVAAVTGPCRNLADDRTCRIYERRPLVCRIYPAEINPFIQLQPSQKACPPEAWDSHEPLVTGYIRKLIERSRQADQDDAPQKNLLCRQLRMNVAAITSEGFIRFSPEVDTLLGALRGIRLANLRPPVNLFPWRLFSSRTESVNRLLSNGAAIAIKGPNDPYSYLLA